MYSCSSKYPHQDQHPLNPVESPCLCQNKVKYWMYLLDISEATSQLPNALSHEILRFVFLPWILKDALMNLRVCINQNGFVNGSIGRPNENTQDLQSWIEKSDIILSCLTNAIAKELQGSAAHVEAAREIWVDLEERCTQGIAPRYYELESAISLLKQDRASISSYLCLPISKHRKSLCYDNTRRKQKSVATNCISTIEATALLTKGVNQDNEKLRMGVIGYPPDWRKPGKKNNKKTNNDPMQFRGHQKNQKEQKALKGMALVATIEEAISPVPVLIHGMTKEEWLVDTSATSNITYVISCISNKIVHTALLTVEVPNGYMDLPTRMLIGVGRETNGLYYLEPIKGGQELMLKNSVSARSQEEKGMSRIDLTQLIIFDGLSAQETNWIRQCDTSENCTIIKNSEVVPTSTSSPLVTLPKPYASSSHDSSDINQSTASRSIDSTFLALSKCSRQVSRKWAINYKWVYIVKYKHEGSIERYKARSVAKRDVNNVFQHRELHEEVYMKIQQGYAKQGKKDCVDYKSHCTSQITKRHCTKSTQFLHAPRKPNLEAAYRILHYLKRIPCQGILFHSDNSLSINAYYDVDWERCLMTRRSTTRYIVFLGKSPISWRSKKQTVASRSSAEDEYSAMTTTPSKIFWFLRLLLDIHLSSSLRLHYDLKKVSYEWTGKYWSCKGMPPKQNSKHSQGRNQGWEDDNDIFEEIESQWKHVRVVLVHHVTENVVCFQHALILRILLCFVLVNGMVIAQLLVVSNGNALCTSFVSYMGSRDLFVCKPSGSSSRSDISADITLSICSAVGFFCDSLSNNNGAFLFAHSYKFQNDAYSVLKYEASIRSPMINPATSEAVGTPEMQWELCGGISCDYVIDNNIMAMLWDTLLFLKFALCIKEPMNN
uniref:Reverse transcriptase Ty1/copia-type domain-containing protein n=1 Tax=Solanum lycopersicum TaxID=4081 RepID=A0A3Q7IFX5_SOLLC